MVNSSILVTLTFRRSTTCPSDMEPRGLRTHLESRTKRKRDVTIRRSAQILVTTLTELYPFMLYITNYPMSFTVGKFPSSSCVSPCPVPSHQCYVFIRLPPTPYKLSDWQQQTHLPAGDETETMLTRYSCFNL